MKEMVAMLVAVVAGLACLLVALVIVANFPPDEGQQPVGGITQQEHDEYYAGFYNATPVTAQGTRLNPNLSLHFRFLVGLPDDTTPSQVAEAYAKPPVRASLPSGLPRARMFRGSQYSDGQ